MEYTCAKPRFTYSKSFAFLYEDVIFFEGMDMFCGMAMMDVFYMDMGAFLYIEVLNSCSLISLAGDLFWFQGFVLHIVEV